MFISQCFFSRNHEHKMWLKWRFCSNVQCTHSIVMLFFVVKLVLTSMGALGVGSIKFTLYIPPRYIFFFMKIHQTLISRQICWICESLHLSDQYVLWKLYFCREPSQCIMCCMPEGKWCIKIMLGATKIELTKRIQVRFSQDI